MDSFAVIRDFAKYTNNPGDPEYAYYAQQYKGAYEQDVLASDHGPVYSRGAMPTPASLLNSGGPQGKGGYRRMQQPMKQQKRFMNRHKTSFPFVPLTEQVSHKAIAITRNGIFCFHGYQSPLTLQHRSSFMVDGKLLKSVDQYYQMNKVIELAGVESTKFTDGSTGNYSNLAKELLRQKGIALSQTDEWRTTRGVFFIQKALLEKAKQCDEYKNALIKTGDSIIVQSYAGEDFFGAGVPFKYCKDWAESMEKNKITVKFPMTFPLSDEDLKGIPTIGKGRNVLGAIHMILREKINDGVLQQLTIDEVDETMDNETSLEATVNQSQNQSMDFTADVDVSNSIATSTSLTDTNTTRQTQTVVGANKIKIPVISSTRGGGYGRGGGKAA